MLWKVLQFGVFAAVMASNAAYGWGDGASGLAVAVVALIAAWIATALPIAIIDQARRLRPQHRGQASEGLRESGADSPALDRVAELRDGRGGNDLLGQRRPGADHIL